MSQLHTAGGSEHPFSFDVTSMRKLMDGHNLEDRDWLFNLMIQSNLFNPKLRGGKVFVVPDYNQSMEQQREMTMKRIQYLLDHGVFQGWLTGKGFEDEMRKLALLEVIEIFDHSLLSRLASTSFYGVGLLIQLLSAGWAVYSALIYLKSVNDLFPLMMAKGWCCPVFGTKRHHDKWLNATENYMVKGCFAMTELGHGSNVRGIETITTYDSKSREFVINTPCESAQKYWIGVQLMFDNVRIPRENLLNSVADVSPDGKYLSAIKDPDQRFGAFMAPLTSGRVTIAASAVYSAKISLAIAIRYSLTRRAFSITPNSAEVLLLDYPSHQRRLLPLLAKTYAMSFAANHLKLLYVKRTPQLIKTLHVVSSAFKAILTWHNMRTLQECREACGGQGLKTENRVGQLKGEFDVQSTFEGDNNVLMQQNDIFCLRERDLLNRFAAEVSKYQAQGESKESAFVASYQLAEDLGRAFSDRAILQTFLEAGNNATDAPLKNALGLLRSMYVLVTLDEDAAFLRYGYLNTENAAIVRKEVAKLCSEMRPQALALVSSFGIPDAFLSPIAFDWGFSSCYLSE
ncbi:hypothetical protein DH2020_031922 [Rehmannia glutinosa]|uniref:Acyl-coenzyme A oxidase n=1 Tax=Rehmannia glutinosa TaxID=99300 RepID=A0ABR0VK24_REHGL